jgi:hypothetical protein
LAPPFFEQTALLDFALDLIALQHALSLEIEPALHVAIAARLELLPLLLLDGSVDELIAG